MESPPNINDNIADGNDDTGRVEKESVSSGSTASIGYDDFFFGKFCRHIPRVLRHQLISKLVNQYVYKMKEGDSMPDSDPDRVLWKAGDAGVDFKANTSIYRFHGALLFVDISGFTVLSQKLKVDDLKNHINAYFQKIVDIIDKYDGEIIKFAGDALFIVWQTKVSDTADENFLQASKDATDKAVRCGKEINLDCGNYLIRLGSGSTSQGSAKTQNFLGSIENPVEMSAPRTSPDKPESPSWSSSPARKKKTKEAQVTYLNVHAGVSVGVMAGMDVGAHDRFEYMLLGQPMNDVAIAEGDAGKGEIVISPIAHSILHGFSSLQSTAPLMARETICGMVGGDSSGAGNGGDPSPVALDPSHPLACGCTVTPSGYYNINTSLADELSVAFTRSDNANTMHPEGDIDSQNELNTYALVMNELMSSYKVVSPLLQKELADFCFKMVDETTTQDTESKDEQTDGGSCFTDSSSRRANLDYTEKEVLTEHFFSWAQHCLLDDIAMHVHEVVRNGFSFYQESRASPFDHFLHSPKLMENIRRELEKTVGVGIVGSSCSSISSDRSIILISSASSISPIASRQNLRSEPNSYINGGRHGESFVTKMRQITGLGTLKDRKHNKHQKVLSKDGAQVSELRNVIVLFISIKMENSSLYLDPECYRHQEGKMIQTCKVNSFHFLSRTTEEMEADKKLINQFQSCMEVLTEVFYAKGGQLRQFIVDDKGTVCIGTFGLRGSVNYDNAASAIDAADSIVSRLQALGFNASVGVTSGAAYCGLVGSNTRHEYAVMGPSTNLSARLMGRAAEGEIICDTNIRQRDRMHAFASLGAVKAKGYAHPVPIFQPCFGDANNVVQLSLEHPVGDKLHVVKFRNSKIFGRKEVVVDMFRFFICDGVKGGKDELCCVFWNQDVLENKFTRDTLAYDAEPFAFNAKMPGLQRPSRVRFDLRLKVKKNTVIGSSGMGKTAVLNLMQHKLRALIARDEEFYNIAILRHQVGYINSTTLFSAWFCLIRQTLHNIAIALAATGDAHMVACLAAFQADDCAPLMDFLKDYLSPSLRPYTSLLSLVGIKFKNCTEDENTHVFEPGREMSGMNRQNAAYNDTDPDSENFDPVNLLDAAEKLERCAELMVAIIQLHVSITRKVTLYIMDDLQMYDVASQDLGRLISDHVTGVILLTTYRTSPQQHWEDVDQPFTLSDAAATFTPGMGFFEAAMRSMPESPTFRKAELPPLCDSAIKKLLLRICTSFGLNHVGENVLDKLFEMSGGSPLYATELAKAVCSRYVSRECADNTPDSETCTDGMLKIISSMRTDRIEEMVHFRFDKLTEQCQLVLKMAAVASLNGSHFTLSMLTSILDSSDKSESAKLDAMTATTRMLLNYHSDSDDDNDEDADADDGSCKYRRGNAINSSMDLVQAINDLLESEDFIELCGDNTELNHQGSTSSNLCTQPATVPSPVASKPDLIRLQSESDRCNDGHDRNTLQQLQFHWKVDMELRAIYDLMLNEQKESLHDRVAAFLEQEARNNKLTSTADWYEQAFHWERATGWSSAMTCYFNAGMLLKEQGDLQGARVHFTNAYRMIDKMRHDAGVTFLDCTRLNTQCAAASVNMQLHQPHFHSLPETGENLRDYLLGGRNVGMKLKDLHRIFEGSSTLMQTGLSVLVCLAQSLISLPNTVEHGYRMFEDAMAVVVLAHRDNADTNLEDVNGGKFLLRNEEIGFPAFSGIFLMLLNDQVYEADRSQGMSAVVSLHMEYASAMPEYKMHLNLAYQNRIRLLESFLHVDPGSIPLIITCTDTMWLHYDCDKHSKELIHFYNSDRTGNATSVALKVFYMMGHFAQGVKYLNLIKESVFKIKHFLSTSITVFAAYPIMLLCNPDAEAQIIIQKLAAREAKQSNKDFFETRQIYQEALNLSIQHQQYARCRVEAVFDKESVLVESILQARTLVQTERSVYHLNYARRNFMPIEYVAARICYLKALRWELCALATKKCDVETIAMCHDKANSYLLLGLEHLSFTADQDALNEQLLFAKANERLLRVQILIKLMVTCVDAEKSRIMWTTARDNLEQTICVAEKCNFQLLLLQAGMHLKTLAALILPPLFVTAAATDDAAVGPEQSDQSNVCERFRISQRNFSEQSVHAALCESLYAHGDALESKARAYIEDANKDSGLNVEELYRSILMQYPSD